MRTGEEATSSKPSNPSFQNQENPMAAYTDWSNSMQAYYGAGGTPPPFFPPTVASPGPHPYVWGGQHPMMPPYGTPVPYPSMYPPGGVYAHPSMTMAHSSAMTNTELAGKSANVKDQVSAQKTRLGKVALSSGNEAASQSAESGTEGSSDDTETANGNAPAQVVPGTNMNIGMSLWNSSEPNAGGAAKARTNPSAATSTVPKAMAEQWMDERELKKQKRKQSNRESARRSRLRKQAECDDLQIKVDSLANENRGLREELQRLSEECEKLTSENTSIKDELSGLCGPEAVANLEQAAMNSAAHPHTNN